MRDTKGYDAWLQAGYDLFSQEGHEGIQVERLARIIDLNKSGFYHYFGDRDTFFEHLMLYHTTVADQFKKEIDVCTSFDPGYLEVVMKYKVPMLINNQLVRNRHIKLFEHTFAEIRKKVKPSVVRIWSEYLGIPDRPELTMRYFEMIQGTFYSRVTPDNFEYEFVRALSAEVKMTVEAMIRSESSVE
jgi:AcrR family transcriptional regulator